MENSPKVVFYSDLEKTKAEKQEKAANEAKKIATSNLAKVENERRGSGINLAKKCRNIISVCHDIKFKPAN